ncbi:MAG: PAS domain-containing protein [Kouleothrix sp.]|nr:PAS domain-containing protein [Kouleothrix sp.]
MNALPYVILFLIPAATSAALAAYGWPRRTSESRPFSLLMGAVALWSICHALSVASPTFEGTLFWAQVQYAGIVLVGPLWLLFALAYANRWELATRTRQIVLLAPSALAFVAVLTNSWHRLWWPSVLPDTSRDFMSLAVTRGPLFWLHATYSYGCVLFGMGLFVYTMIESRLIYRNQARLVVLGGLFPLVGNIALLMGLRLRYIDDPTPFLFVGSGLVMFYAARHYHLLDLAPVAQREIFEGMPDGVVVLDRRGVVAAVNTAAARLLAIEPGAWVGQAARNLANSSPLAGALGNLLEAPAAGAPTATITATYTGHDGQRVVEARLRPLAAGQRERAGAMLLLRDVTEQARLAQQLDRRLGELTLLNEIARAANAAAQTGDLLRTITGEIIRAMAWDRVVIGILQPDDSTLRIVVDESPHEIEQSEGNDVSAADFGLIFEIMRTGETCVLNAADPALSGTTTLATMRRLDLQTGLVAPLYQRGAALGVLLVGHTAAQAIAPEDLRLYETVGKLIGDAITRARLYEAANEASALKSAFLATISHELRTPLTSIIGYADMLEGGIFGQLPEAAIEPLDHVRRSGQALLRMINDILDFSKMEAGHFNVDLYPVDLATVIRGVAGALLPQIRQRELGLALDLAPDLPLVQANSTRLEQVVTNLLANAIKFTDAGSISVRAEVHGDRVRISVEDTGIGIAPEEVRQLFQPFHQIDNQITRRYGGSGLGLAISRRLIDLMHGTIGVESAPGAGSTFYCELRVAAHSSLMEIAVS